MNKTTRNTSAFTLIELLMVIAIIGILAGILIPTVGAVKKQANIAASKSQLSNYVTAIGMFKSEYKFYPELKGASGGDESETASLKGSTNSKYFIETLSGRDVDGKTISSTVAKDNGNRRKISFHSFSESEFWWDDDKEEAATDLIADRFNNQEIHIVIDSTGNGFVKPSPASDKITVSDKIRTPVTAYVEAGDNGEPAYALWN